MRRDLDDLVAAIQKSCRSLFLLNFPTTGWFGDKTVTLVERTLARGVGRLMVTISIDGPKALHEEMRGLPGSWDRGDRNVPAAARHRAVELPDGDRHDADGEERRAGSTRRSPRSAQVIPDFRAIRTAPERRPRVRALLRQRRLSGRAAARRDPARDRRASARRTARRSIRSSSSRIAIRRSSASTTKPASRRCRARRCRRRASSTPTGTCIACSIWDEKVGNLRDNALRPARAVGQRPAARAARGRRRRTLLALLDAVRGVSDDPRQPRARGGVARHHAHTRTR